MAQLFKFEFNLQLDGLHLGRTATYALDRSELGAAAETA